ncbi:MAG: GNAT family protein [Ilumatobacteraceae bacterium]
MITLPLTTKRLRIRMMRTEDLQAFVEYRNQPDVARNQDWALPYTTEMAEGLIQDQFELDGPADGQWVQMAVEHGDEVIGDVAAGVHDSGRQATIGYTISAHAQGKGYATEAVAAVLAALFAEAGLHRVVASIDPRNPASRRVLEKLGFRYEGRSPSSVFIRGEWTDDDHFALLAGEHLAGITANVEKK